MFRNFRECFARSYIMSLRYRIYTEREIDPYKAASSDRLCRLQLKIIVPHPLTLHSYKLDASIPNYSTIPKTILQVSALVAPLCGSKRLSPVPLTIPALFSLYTLSFA